MQVLITLSNNSIKFTNQSGNITVKLEVKERGMYKITIEDDDGGIEQHKQSILMT